MSRNSHFDNNILIVIILTILRRLRIVQLVHDWKYCARTNNKRKLYIDSRSDVCFLNERPTCPVEFRRERCGKYNVSAGITCSA